VDGEGLYIDIGPENPEHVNPQSQQRDPEPSQSDTCNDSDSDDESSSDDEIIKDSEPPQKTEASYNKMDPPMAVGTLYSDMAAFKLALATHATKYEFHYNIEASDKSRYKVYCSGKNVGCRWRIHASTLSDEVTVKVIFFLSY